MVGFRADSARKQKALQINGSAASRAGPPVRPTEAIASGSRLMGGAYLPPLLLLLLHSHQKGKEKEEVWGRVQS